MVMIILLLILVVLLFGSSVVLGVLGHILGFIVAAGTLIYASVSLDMNIVELIFYGIAGIIILFGAMILIANIIDSFDPKLKKAKIELEKSMARLSPKERREVEEQVKQINKTKH